MADYRDIPQDKTMGEMGREAFLFITHTLVAVVFLAITVGVMSLHHPDPDSSEPKQFATILAFVVPAICSFLLARIHHNNVAAYVWVSGLIFFSIVCVQVLNLPTGNGLCENCGPAEKLWRTFFTFDQGSGLLGGHGLLIGTWIPLSMIGYAVGARLAIKR